MKIGRRDHSGVDALRGLILTPYQLHSITSSLNLGERAVL